MSYGKTATVLLAVGAAANVCMFVLSPAPKSALEVLGILTFLFSFPLALTIGVMGIVRDRKKALAIVTAAIAAIPTAFIVVRTIAT
jgi:hypothetical protein